MDADERSDDVEGVSGEVQDVQLWDLLTGLVRDRGRVGAARALGVNFRTLVGNVDSGKLSPRMRRALGEMVKSGVAAPGQTEEPVGALERRVVSVEEEVEGLRETVEAQVKRLGELEGRLAEMEESGNKAGEPDSDVGEKDSSEWAPPKRAYGLPDAGVVTMEEQPDEGHAFGPAAELVAEWRVLRTREAKGLNRVERARAEERRWELEVAMIGEFGLTLPPETEPLNEARRDDHLGWRRKTLRQARTRRVRAERLRRVLTLNLWRR